MNASIAELIRDRIEALSFVDKIAGLVRVVEKVREGAKVIVPVGIEVTDPLQCEESTLLSLVPDKRYTTIVYFEDRGCTPVKTRTRGTTWTSHIRLVCWVNTAKLNGDQLAGDKIQQRFIGAIAGSMYNSGPFLGIKHRMEGIPAKGAAIFNQYTYDQSARPYLMHPYDAFAIDIATEFRIKPGCEDQVDVTDVNCWTPPTTNRRRHPKDFTCEELNDPETGLTDEQKADCLDCTGGGTTDPCPLSVTVNGEEIATVSNACATPAVALLVKDQNGNTLTATFDGNTIVITMIDPFVHKANIADAEADTTTALTAQQMLVLDDCGAQYPGPGGPADTPAARIAAKKHSLGVIDGANNSEPVLRSPLPEGTFEIQANPYP